MGNFSRHIVLLLSILYFKQAVSITFEKPSEIESPDGYLHKPGYCTMFDECGVNEDNQKKVNCQYNGKAKLLTDKDGLELLQEICPYLYKGDNDTRICCSVNQLHTLKDNLKLPYQYLSRCPSCYRNFVATFCEMTCSPNQSVYTSVVHNQTGEHKEDPHIVPYNNSVLYITELAYNLTNDFANNLFNSCNHVNSPSTNTPALKILCGPYGDSCTGQKWITFMNEVSNGQAPFQIDVSFVDNVAIAMNYSTDKCNEPTFAGEDACSCSDCPAACSGPPPTPPPPPQPWLIWGIDGYYVVMMFSYIGFLFIFGNVVIWSHLCRRRKGTSYSSLDHEDCCSVVDSSSVSAREDDLGLRSVDVIKPTGEPGWLERWGHFLEGLLQAAFRRLGTFCAKHPVIVLFLGVIVVAGCSVGLKFMTITTDPVELWSAPTSQSRIRKNYFDQHFGPFYRTEELIITVNNGSRTIYHPYSDTTDEQTIPFGPILAKPVLAEILELQNKVVAINATYKNRTITLQDICMKPLAPDNTHCTIMSVLNYFQNDLVNLNKEVWINDNFSLGADYHDHLMSCTKGPAAVDDTTHLHMSCLGTYGGPVFPWVALGGFDAKNYLNATAAVITIPVINYYDNPEKLGMALAWEKEYIAFMKDFVKKPGNLTVRFSAERSIEDEINRESGADVLTIIISYMIMFAYVAIALGRFNNLNRILIDCQLTVGLCGVLIVLCSVAMALGIFSYAGVPLTLIIVEVVPFLALAVGVDNIFILVQHLQRDERGHKETVEEQVGRVLGEVAPSMFLSSISETVAFFLGGLSTMPAVRTFSMFAGLTIFCDFLLQITCFVAILALDTKRQNAMRPDCFCCLETDVDDEQENDGLLYAFFKKLLAPFVLFKYTRPLVVVFFVGLAFFSGAVLHKVEIGLDQSLSMPEDSYVLGYFDYLNRYLSVGAPVYFVVPDGHDYTSLEGANQVCGTTGCDNNSLVEQISTMAKMPNYSHIAYPVSSWIDDFFDWLKPQSACCNYRDGPNDTESFCPASGSIVNCTTCRTSSENLKHPRPSSEEFMEFLPWFLKDNPGLSCGKGGHAAYGTAVNIVNNGTNNGTNTTTVGATYFMGFHTIARTSKDFIGCLRMADEIAANISDVMKVDVFPYSVFYVFYEQYLTIVHDTLFNLGISLAAVFVVVFVVLGCDIVSAIIVVLTIAMILLDMFGCMFLWNIPLNAVSLVNLVMAIGISVEFCSHITRTFALSQRQTRVARAEEALAEMGSSVFSGITLTKFVGIVILAFSKSQIFRIFYFRMYLCVVLLGASHGLIFLPVLLSYVGPRRRNLFHNHKRLVEDYSDDDAPPMMSSSTSDDDLTVPPFEARHTNAHPMKT